MIYIHAAHTSEQYLQFAPMHALPATALIAKSAPKIIQKHVPEHMFGWDMYIVSPVCGAVLWPLVFVVFTLCIHAAVLECTAQQTLGVASQNKHIRETLHAGPVRAWHSAGS